MLRVNVSFVQIVQALSIAGFGLALAFVPLVLVWAIDRAFEADLLLMWRAAADAWLMGHGVTLHVDLPDSAAILYGSEQAAKPFDVTLWPLGFTVFTALMSFASGRRLHEGAHSMAADVRARLQEYDGVGTPERLIGQVLGWGVAAATVTTGAVGLIVAWTAQHDLAAPDMVHAAVFPGLIVLLAHLVALAWLDRARLTEWVAERLRLSDRWWDLLGAAATAAGATLVAVLGLGAGAVALAIFTHFDQLVALTEASSPTILGVIVLFLAQLALLPNAILWGSAWMLGAPVHLGEASSFSVFGTTLGPLPNIPLLGAVPAQAEPWFLALPVVTALSVLVLAMLVARQRLPYVEAWWEPVAVAGIAGVGSAAILSLLAAASGGALGPGRMQVSGPDALQTLLIAGVGVTVLIGLGFWGNRGLELAMSERERPDDGAWVGVDDEPASPWSRRADDQREQAADADPGSLVADFDTAEVEADGADERDVD